MLRAVRFVIWKQPERLTWVRRGKGHVNRVSVRNVRPTRETRAILWVLYLKKMQIAESERT
jgi:hypothetical protein